VLVAARIILWAWFVELSELARVTWSIAILSI